MIGQNGRRGRIGLRVGLVLFSGLTILSFTNCSQPMQTDAKDVFASEAAKVDFAYDTTIDQIAYMSCAPGDSGLDGGAYFTFRVGAYRDAGIQLKDEFFTAMGRKPLEKQIALLSASPANTATAVQLSLRGRTNYQTFVATNASAPVNGKDYWNMLDTLGTSDMSEYLIKNANGTRVKYMRNGTAYGARMEGSLAFTNNLTLAADVRSKFSSSSLNSVILALTYAHSNGNSTNGSETLARSPADVIEGSSADPVRSVYGRGYEIGFGRPTIASLYADFPANVLGSVSERNLETGYSVSSSWTCPVSMQFRIVRSEDAGTAGANCVKKPDPDPLASDATTLKERQIVRNALRTEDWWIDWTNKCIISKRSGTACYGGVTNIAYTMSTACSATAPSSTAPACVHFASLCYR